MKTAAITKLTLLCVAAAFTFFYSCASSSGGKNGGKSFTDPRDGKKYKFTQIGPQTWMAENLNFDVKDSKCYEDKPQNCQKYGRLYNSEMAKTACPPGWRLPTAEQWDTLNAVAGGRGVGGKNLRAVKGWKVTGADSGDKFGFSALPAGVFTDIRSSFYEEGFGAYWWTATETDDKEYMFMSNRHINEAYYALSVGVRNTAAINNYSKYVAPNMGNLYKNSTKNHVDIDKYSLISVRCIKE